VMVVGGMLIGLINGLLVVKWRISAFVATLGTGFILSALTEGISGGTLLFGGSYKILVNLADDKVAGIGISVLAALVIALIMLWLLEHVPLGRKWYAIGGSERVAFLAGVPTKRLRVLAFVAAGLLVSVAAIFQLGSAADADPTFGPQLLLPAYATVFVGVTTHRPGYYNVVGTVVGLLVLAVGFNGLTLLGVPVWVEPLFDGVILIAAVLLARAEARTIKVGA
jgi:ribose transport system permease protein